jgi:lipoprotein-releasing system permease protein
MNSLDIFRIARRYTFAFGKGYLSTFLSLLSMTGLVLAIALLIIVLSVMNGFDKEMRERILSLVPHVTLYAHLPIVDWQDKAKTISAHPAVQSVEPFSQFDALLMHGGDIETARVVGLDFPLNPIDTDTAGADSLAGHLAADELAGFRADDSGLILGSALARNLAVVPGDSLTLLVPDKRSSELAQGARYETVTVRALLHTGTELDQNAALTHLALASRLAGLERSPECARLRYRRACQKPPAQVKKQH